MLCAGRLPFLPDGLTEQVRKVIDICRAHYVCLISFGLEPFFRWIWSGDGSKMHRAGLGAKRFEDPFALVVFDFGIGIDFDNEARNIGDDDSQWEKKFGSRIFTHNSNLDVCDSKSPNASSEAFDKAAQGLLNLFRE